VRSLVCALAFVFWSPQALAAVTTISASRGLRSSHEFHGNTFDGLTGAGVYNDSVTIQNPNTSVPPFSATTTMTSEITPGHVVMNATCEAMTESGWVQCLGQLHYTFQIDYAATATLTATFSDPTSASSPPIMTAGLYSGNNQLSHLSPVSGVSPATVQLQPGTYQFHAIQDPIVHSGANAFSMQLELTVVETPNNAGTVIGIHGSATVKHADGSTTPLSANDAIAEGDVITTGENGAVNLRFNDNTSLVMGENSILDISQYQWDAEQQSGSAFYSWLQGIFVYTSGLIGQDAVDIQTPVSSIGIRGTEFIAEVDELTGTGQIDLISGEIELLRFETSYEAPITIQIDEDDATTAPLTQAAYDQKKNAILSPSPASVPVSTPSMLGIGLLLLATFGCLTLRCTSNKNFDSQITP
jgi:hypothetical protein